MGGEGVTDGGIAGAASHAAAAHSDSLHGMHTYTKTCIYTFISCTCVRVSMYLPLLISLSVYTYMYNPRIVRVCVCSRAWVYFIKRFQHNHSHFS